MNHGLYIQNKTCRLFSWGDNTFGQTGNKYTDNLDNHHISCEQPCLLHPEDDSSVDHDTHCGMTKEPV